MKIKISQLNRAALEAVVAESNAGAESHTTHAGGLLEFAHSMELKLAELDIPKRDRPNAIGCGMSGGSVPKAYKYSRIVSRYEIIRGASDWFLIGLKRVDNHGNAAADKLSLTPAQRDIAISKFTSQFVVQSGVALAVAA